MRLKICGMKYAQNMREVAGLQPDYLGFIFYGKSPRFCEVKVPEIQQRIRKTGVFVNASLMEIKKTVKRNDLKAVQLHGEESPELCTALQEENLEVIKVFSVGNNFDFAALQEYEGKVDFFLFDTKGPARGGNGRCFDWEVLRRYPSETPFFLSGGIGLEEIGAVKDLYTTLKIQKKQHLLYGLDVNSKFETAPGIKDLEQLKEFKTRLDLLLI